MAAHPGSWRVRPIRLLIVLLVTAAGLAGCTGGRWSATAQFTATSAGEVTLSQWSVGGSYGSLTDDALTSDGGTTATTPAAQADAHAKLLALLAEQ
jgi:hypothetical protein